jgi:hypothetical protein
MRRIGRIPVLAIAGLLSFSSVAYGDDLAEVRTLFEKDIHLLNAHNNDAFRGSPETFKRQRHSESLAGQTEQVCGASSEGC